MIGVITCSEFDLLSFHGPAFAEWAPELTLLRPEEVTDPGSVEFVLTFKPGADAFAPYPNLKAVSSIAAGVDAILACPSLPKGIPVLRVEDADQALQMAGFALFHVLWHQRQMGLMLESQKRGQWNRPRHGRSPRLKHIGVMGFGLMGRAIARAGVALGYSVSSLSRSMPEPEPGVTHFVDRDLTAFLGDCDFLVNVLPLTEATRGILGKSTFDALPKGASLIQLGRGAHLDDDALLDALDSGQLAGASLDAFDVEPLPADHIFWSHPRIFVTPHTASAPESKNVAVAIRDMMMRVMAGETLSDRAVRGY